jgi:hypothetical protein
MKKVDKKCRKMRAEGKREFGGQNKKAPVQERAVTVSN